MAENKQDRIVRTYEYYIDILDLMLGDMSSINILDVQDVLDELHEEIRKIKES